MPYILVRLADLPEDDYKQRIHEMLVELAYMGLVELDARRPVRVRYWPDGVPRRFDPETGEVLPVSGDQQSTQPAEEQSRAKSEASLDGAGGWCDHCRTADKCHSAECVWVPEC